MAYDNSLDKELFGENVEFDNCRITVSVYSYNNATPKLQISRETKDGEEYKFAKLGRMTKQEIETILPLIQKAIKHM